jgi:hypothetical protein
MRRIIPVILAVLASVAILWMAVRVDRGSAPAREGRIGPAMPMVEPTPLTDAERESARRPGAPGSIALERGAWVQVAGADGQLEQQYSATKLDPEPGAYLSMLEPRAVFYLSDGRVATLRADAGRVHVPNRALESGRFTGEVVIRLYRPEPGAAVDLATDAPSAILETPQLDFDTTLSQITCEQSFRLTTDMLTFDGEGLDLLLGEDTRTVERLVVERALGPVVIDRRRMGTAGGSRRAAARAAGGADAALARPSGPSAHEAFGSGDAIPCSVFEPAPQPVRFYRLDLNENVELTRYSPLGRADARGDLLSVVMTLESDLLSRSVAGGVGAAPAGSRETAALPRHAPHVSLPPHAALLLASLATVQSPPPADPEDIIVIRFTGRLTMDPVPAGSPVPASPGDIEVTIDGEEVLLADAPSLAMRAGHVDLSLAQRAAGDSRQATPRTLVATGGVEATDGTQTLWSDALRVTFADRAGGLGADATLGEVDVARAQADGGVQVALKDGARIFATAIDAFPPERRAELAGPDVAVIRAGVLLDGMPALSVNERERSVRSQGAGRARSWPESLVGTPGPADPTRPDLPPARVARPTAFDRTPEFEATWTGSMSYVDRGNEGALLEVKDAVRVRAEPRLEEFDALDAASVTIEFERAPGALPLDRGDAGVDIRARRVLAVGDARVENQVWPTAARSGQPRLFRLRGPRIDYDTVTSDTDVPGAGDVLVHVPPGQAKTRTGSVGEGTAPGGGIEGTSRFRWQRAMRMALQPDGRHLMTMDGSVELVRAGADADDTLTLTCDRIEALLDRPEAGDAATRARREDFGLGGSAELLRVRGIGRCFVRTPQYDMECEEFDYDVRTQIAELRARPGRTVSVLGAGQVAPVRAAGVVWDLASGRIELRSASGTVGR